MTQSASKFPQNPAGTVLKRDKIRHGATPVFSGDSEFKMLMYVMTPLMLMVHIATIYTLTGGLRHYHHLSKVARDATEILQEGTNVRVCSPYDESVGL